MTNYCTAAYDCFRRRFWQDEGRGPGNLLALKCLRVLVLAGRGLIRNQSLVRSSALAYATILGFIPLFAILFAILQALGVPRLLTTHLLENLAPGSRDFATQILQYIEATRVTSLGVFGVVVLLLDLVIVMTNVEKAFNKTWQVSRTRTWNRKVTDYLSIFLIFPILMAVALTFSTSFWGLRYVVEILSGILPAIFFTATRWLVSLWMLWLAFIFIYLVMPNAQVRFWSAVLGGVVGGTVWQLAQWIFTSIQGASTYYNAIYGALYHLLFLFIWLFWCWLILLFGTEVAFAHQNLDGLTRQYRRPLAPPEPVDDYLCLAALVKIGERFLKQQPPLSRDELRQMLPRGNNLVYRVTQTLQDCNLAVEVVPAQPGSSAQFLPKLPLNQVTVREVLDGLRQFRGAALDVALAGDPQLITLLKPLVEAPAPGAWEKITLQQLVESLPKDAGLAGPAGE